MTPPQSLRDSGSSGSGSGGAGAGSAHPRQLHDLGPVTGQQVKSPHPAEWELAVLICNNPRPGVCGMVWQRNGPYYTDQGAAN